MTIVISNEKGGPNEEYYLLVRDNETTTVLAPGETYRTNTFKVGVCHSINKAKGVQKLKEGEERSLM